MICPACQADNDDGGEVCSSCGQSLRGQALGPGSVVAGRYEILGTLGRGGMGIVFKARDRSLEETVALKMLRADVARTPDLEHRFRSEIKLARRVRHRNVCGIHEYGEDGPLRYIAMELVEGTDLKAWLRARGALPAPEAYAVAIQLTQGLEAIHESGVVHRDLKASNVMLDRHGRVRLMDFGIAKQLGVEATLGATGLGHILGTPEYMSPEQARGDRLDFRSDLYSLGVVMYETFTGHVPFRGSTPIATIFKALEQPPVLEGPEAAGIPAPMVPVLARALAKDRAARFASARELREAIQAAERAPAQEASGRSPNEAPTVRISTHLTEVGLTATPVPAPTLRPSRIEPLEAAQTPDASTAPTRLLEAPRAAGHRTVWPWFLAASIAGALLAGGIAILVHRLLASTTDASRQARQVEASAEPGRHLSSPSAPPPAATVDPGSPWSRVPPLERPWGAISPPPETPPPRSLPTPPARVPMRNAAPVPPSTAMPSPTRASDSGLLQLNIIPWAAVTIDGTDVGTTPLRPLPLTPGSHTVRLTHPDYQPLQRKLAIRPGETTRLEIDLAWEALPK